MKKRLTEEFEHYILSVRKKGNEALAETFEAFEALGKALEKGERSTVLKRLADVEFILPVLPRLFRRKIKLVIKKGRRCDFAEGSSIFADIIQYNIEEYGFNIRYPWAFEAMLLYVCRSLGNIYDDYNIAPAEVDVLINEKAKALRAAYSEGRI